MSHLESQDTGIDSELYRIRLKHGAVAEQVSLSQKEGNIGELETDIYNVNSPGSHGGGSRAQEEAQQNKEQTCYQCLQVCS